MGRTIWHQKNGNRKWLNASLSYKEQNLVSNSGRLVTAIVTMRLWWYRGLCRQLLLLSRFYTSQTHTMTHTTRRVPMLIVKSRCVAVWPMAQPLHQQPQRGDGATTASVTLPSELSTTCYNISPAHTRWADKWLILAVTFFKLTKYILIFTLCYCYSLHQWHFDWRNHKGF